MSYNSADPYNRPLTPRQLPAWLEDLPRLPREGWGRPVPGAPPPTPLDLTWQATARANPGRCIYRSALRPLAPAEPWQPAPQVKDWILSRRKAKLVNALTGVAMATWERVWPPAREIPGQPGRTFDQVIRRPVTGGPIDVEALIQARGYDLGGRAVR